MPNVGLTNLTAGEVSPDFWGRPDTARYGNGCVRLENFLLTTTGMYTFRPGFELMGFPKDTGKDCLLRRFRFSDEQGNVIELGELYARFWHTLGQVADRTTGLPVEVVTPFPADELDLLGYCQSADFLFIVHENRGIFTIQRHDLETWTFSVFDLIDGPYGKENADTTLILRLSAPTGSDYPIEAVGWAAGKEPFGAGDEGRLIRIKAGGSWAWFIVKTVTDSTHVVATAQAGAAPGAADYSDWRLGLYSNRLGWPKVARIHEQRLVLGGPAAIPDRIDGSAIAGFDDFAPRDPLTDDGAYAYALGQEGVDRVVGLGVSNDLIALTGGGENRVSGDSTGVAITPTQVWQKPISPDGAKAGIEPINTGAAVVFVDRYGLNIRSLVYDIRFANYGADNLTLLASHMAWLAPDSPGFQALAWQANPLGTIWTIRGNDQLAGAIYEPKENVLGWHRHVLGVPALDDQIDGDGVMANPAADEPQVVSICTLVGPTHDELWAVVKRELPGRTLRTIERMGRPALWFTPAENQCWLDCSQQLNNTPTADLTPGQAEVGDGVLFQLSNVSGGFAFTGANVGDFIKARWLDRNPTLRGQPVWRTGVAVITAINSATEAVCSIRQAFKSGNAIWSGSWGLTVKRVTGLDHAEGLYVTAVSDGNVLAPAKVVNGAIDLAVPGWEVRVGFPYVGIMVSLPVDLGPSPVIGQGRWGRVNEIKLRVLNSVGGQVASVPEREDEKVRWEPVLTYKVGEAATPMRPPTPTSGIKQLQTAGEWTREPQYAVRQTRPMPLNVQLLVAHAYAPHVQP